MYEGICLHARHLDYDNVKLTTNDRKYRHRIHDEEQSKSLNYSENMVR